MSNLTLGGCLQTEEGPSNLSLSLSLSLSISLSHTHTSLKYFHLSIVPFLSFYLVVEEGGGSCLTCFTKEYLLVFTKESLEPFGRHSTANRVWESQVSLRRHCIWPGKELLVSFPPLKMKIQSKSSKVPHCIYISALC
jgi:hypothetical protein